MVGPEAVLHIAEVSLRVADVEQHGLRSAGDQPVPVLDAVTHLAHLLHGLADGRVHLIGAGGLELDLCGVVVVRPNEAVALAPARHHGRDLGTQDGIDPAELVADLPADLEEDRVGALQRAVAFRVGCCSDGGRRWRGFDG